MKNIFIVIVASFVVIAGLVTFFSKENHREPDPQIIKTLSQQNDTLSGWVQNINLKENFLVLRRKKLKPFMPKRDIVRITTETIITYNDKKIELKNFQEGWPVKIYFKGSNIQNGEYIADKIEVELN
ncbi:MAG: hypothetical protein KDD58_09930 [Bdellovibrionales bacterium]|nr:hypothetical protein [Bdellovibrionales bacterium]